MHAAASINRSQSQSEHKHTEISSAGYAAWNAPSYLSASSPGSDAHGQGNQPHALFEDRGSVPVDCPNVVMPGLPRIPTLLHVVRSSEFQQRSSCVSDTGVIALFMHDLPLSLVCAPTGGQNLHALLRDGSKLDLAHLQDSSIMMSAHLMRSSEK